MPVVRPRARAAFETIFASRLFKPSLWILCALPLTLLAFDLYLILSGRDPNVLGANPKEALLHSTGQDGLILLLITLTITPLRRIFSFNRIVSVRRMLGVWAFAYAVSHLSIYLAFDQNCYPDFACEWTAIWQDILKRRFIFVGQFAFAILLLLALTSTGGWVRRLKKNWARLHRLVYVAAAAGVIHYVWIQKSDISEPLPYAIWLGGVLLFRVGWAVRKSRQKSSSPVTA